jgi:acetyl/propionyl-CoA carboxylase alpha subunit
MMEDPLLAKVMVHAASRPEAFRLMQSALAKTRLNGPPTNVEFLQVLLSSPSKSNMRVCLN